jgi:pimeloyl-ACP methyl ester carboxylesterase
MGFKSFRHKKHELIFKNIYLSILETRPTCQRPGQPGRVIFFLHGRFGSAEMWNAIMDSLSGQFRCIAIELPGFGSSTLKSSKTLSFIEYAILVNEVVMSFTKDVDQAVLVGHDLGGALAQWCLSRNPHKVASLMLINSLSLSRALKPLIKSPNLGLQEFWVSFWLHRLLQQSRLVDASCCQGLGTAWVSSIQAIEESWPGLSDRRFWKEALAGFVHPVLLLWGKRDSLNAPEIASDLVQMFRNTDYFLNEDTGHWPFLEQKDWVLAKFKTFLFKTDVDHCAWLRPSTALKSG